MIKKINKQNNDVFTSFLDEYFFDAHCQLDYNNDYELAIAVMLSAQTTDIKVNKITPILFKKYPSLSALAKASIDDVEKIIFPLGLAKNKAKNVIGIASTLIEKYSSKLPSDKNELMSLPGIGNKSAGVIRIEIFKIPDLPVDTHVARISKRLGIANESDDPLAIENKLKKIIQKDRWIKTHHQMIFFGRYMCIAKKPCCEKCKLHDYCKEYNLKK